MSTITTRAGKGSELTHNELDANFTNLNADKQEVSSKDASGGYPGLTLFKLNLKNVAGAITSWFTTAATAARTWTMPDKDGTVAMLSDITGTNSGNNTGDETGARIATLHHTASLKSALIDADEITGQDSAASFVLIRTTWASVKAFLKAYFDTLYAGKGANTNITSLSAITSINGGPLGGFRNRIINGGMRIDQRNAGAAVGIASTGAKSVDRFSPSVAAASVGTTAQQATTAPVGFANSLKIAIGTGYSPAAADANRIYYAVEGTDVVDFAWGTASAKTVTLSFRVYCSVTGTFAGGLYTTAGTPRSYQFTYSIPVANTWTNISVTIPGDTSGTWNTGNTVGIYVNWDLGSGSTYQGTAGAWAAGAAWATSGSVKLCATTGATFYITGVQLELGSVATPFEQRPYGTELALCQRYYYRVTPGNLLPLAGTGFSTSATTATGIIKFPVTMRVAPTVLEQTGTATDYGLSRYGAAATTGCSAVPTFATASTEYASVAFTVASGLQYGMAGIPYATTASAYLGFSAEL